MASKTPGVGINGAIEASHTDPDTGALVIDRVRLVSASLMPYSDPASGVHPLTAEPPALSLGVFVLIDGPVSVDDEPTVAGVYTTWDRAETAAGVPLSKVADGHWEGTRGPRFARRSVILVGTDEPPMQHFP